MHSKLTKKSINNNRHFNLHECEENDGFNAQEFRYRLHWFQFVLDKKQYNIINNESRFHNS